MSETLKIGIIGTGSRGVMCFGRLFEERDDCEVVALADTNRERMKVAAGMLEQSTPDLYDTAGEMVEKASVDAVVVTTPDYLHSEHIITALEAGRHVLTDKPLATTTADCLAVAHKARETGRIVDMGFNLRHEIICKKIKALIDEGAIGNIQVIDNRDYYYGGRTYMARWNGSYEKSGGLFCHKGSHDFDLLNWYNEAAVPVKVSAFAGVEVLTPDKLPFELDKGEKIGPYCGVCSAFHKCPDRTDLSKNALFSGAARQADGYNKDSCIFLNGRDTHDNGIAIVEYSNGVRASHWECFFTPASGRRFSIIGDRGHLDAELSQNLIRVYPRHTSDHIDYNMSRPTGGHGGADPEMVATFVANMKAKRMPHASVRDGLLSVVIAEAAELSRREGRTVMVDELLPAEELAQL